MKAITLKNISKKYSVISERPILIKSLISPAKKRDVWALRKISLEVKNGESIGIIGENGSGKSTLLKLIAGVTSPTNGKIQANGKVGSIIELGAGFHPDFTGKENVYLNGALLGYPRGELDSKFPSIVDFAELSDFIDQPVRTYSSGMVVRLAFSVALFLDPDILLIDEVLAVGDESFQKKCIDAILSFKRKKTILFVSHNLSHVAHVSDKCLYLEKGRVYAFGGTDKVISLYTKKVMQPKYFLSNKEGRWGSGDVVITTAKLINKNGVVKNSFYEDEEMSLRLKLKFNKKISNPVFGITIKDQDFKDIFTTNTLWKGIKTGEFKKGKRLKIEFTFKENFPVGKYKISPAVASSNLKQFFDWRDNLVQFNIERKKISGSLAPKHEIKIL